MPFVLAATAVGWTSWGFKGSGQGKASVRPRRASNRLTETKPQQCAPADALAVAAAAGADTAYCHWTRPSGSVHLEQVVQIGARELLRPAAVLGEHRGDEFLLLFLQLQDLFLDRSGRDQAVDRDDLLLADAVCAV
jgi:hypothetical protein